VLFDNSAQLFFSRTKRQIAYIKSHINSQQKNSKTPFSLDTAAELNGLSRRGFALLPGDCRDEKGCPARCQSVPVSGLPEQTSLAGSPVNRGETRRSGLAAL
jgi:hypothetical protein